MEVGRSMDMIKEQHQPGARGEPATVRTARGKRETGQSNTTRATAPLPGLWRVAALVPIAPVHVLEKQGRACRLEALRSFVVDVCAEWACPPLHTRVQGARAMRSKPRAR